jgi:hypothetical protein
MVGLVILVVLGVLFAAAVARVVWSVWRGDMQIEPSSLGRQLSGRGDKKHDD